jgi:predicted alpha/beta-fold hydrolase
VSEFSPAWFIRGPHAQTIWGRVVRPRRMVAFRREVLTTPDGDELVLDHLDESDGRRQMADGKETPSAICHPPSDRLHYVLLHGLEGSSYSVYIQGVLSEIRRRGHAATVLNFRSCARDPKRVHRMLPNRRPRFYHSGETADFDFVIRTLAGVHASSAEGGAPRAEVSALCPRPSALEARTTPTKFVALGASLGGNVLLKWLGEHPDQKLVAAAATLSVPYDLAASARHLETPVGSFYVSRFLRTLRPKVMRPDIAPLLDLPRVLRARTFFEFDDSATGPLHGFTGADDYYERSSSIRFLDRITTPVLALNAEDDPFLPPEVLPRAKAAAAPAIDFRTTRGGGHVGFIGGRAPWRCEYWAEALAVRWLAEAAL